MARLVDLGAVKVFVGRAYPLEFAAGALLRLETRASKGKVVLTVV
jgi:NADPH:quinone reductase-like Zn-dependent oxidoreductase